MTDKIFSMLELYRLHMREGVMRAWRQCYITSTNADDEKAEKLSSRSLRRKISPAEEGNSEHDEHGDPKVEGCDSPRMQKINTDRIRTLRVCAILSK